MNSIFFLILGLLDLNIYSLKGLFFPWEVHKPQVFLWIRRVTRVFGMRNERNVLFKTNKVSEEQVHIQFLFDLSLAQLE